MFFIFTLFSEYTVRHTLKITLTILAFFAINSAYSEELSNSISLSEAWGELLSNDDLLAANKAAVNRSTALSSSAKNLYLPQVDLVGSYSRLESNIEIDALSLNPLKGASETLPGQIFIDLVGGPGEFKTPVTDRNVSRSSINALWPIYTGGRITAQKNVLELSVAESGYVLEKIKRQKFLELVSTYYGLVMAVRALETQEKVESGLGKHLAIANAMERQAQISSVERLSAEAAYDRARVITRALIDKKNSANAALLSLIHADTYKSSNYGDEEIVTTTTPMFILEELPPKTYFEKNISEHPQLKILAVEQDKAENFLALSESLYKPDAFLFGSYSVYEDDSLASDLTPDWVVGVGVRMALVDRSGRKGKVEAAKSTGSEISSLTKAAKRNIDLLLNESYREAQQALSEYRDLGSTVKLAEMTLTMQERAFEEGLGRSLDVIDAQNFLATTKIRRDASAFRFVLSFARLLVLSGEYDDFFSYQLAGDKV